ALTRQVLLRLETGQTKNPEPQVLKAIAALYDLDYSDVVQRFVSARYGAARDLPFHASTGQTDSHLREGESNVPAETRIRQLLNRAEKAEQERDFYKAVVTNAGELATKLSATLRTKGVAGPRRKTTRGRSH